MASQGPAGSVILIATDFPPEKHRLLALNPRGSRLAVAYEDSDYVQVFSSRSGREVTRSTGFQRIFGIEFLSADVLLVTAFHGCFRCDLRRGGRGVLSSESWATGTTVSPNGRIVALGVTRGLVLYDTRKGQVLRHLETYFAEGVRDIAQGRHAAFSAGGRYVAAALGTGYGWPYLVVVWEVHTGRRQRVFGTLAHALAFRDDSLSLALADDWGHIQIYEPDQGEDPALQFEVEYCPRALQFRDGGQTLAALLDGGGFIQFKAGTGQVLRRSQPPTDFKLFSAVASADWSCFAGATESEVVVWPVDRDGQCA
jgi:hypothetical protein